MNPKKILIFSIVYYPQYVGGAEAAVKEITDRIKPDLAKFDLITLRRSTLDLKEEQIGNVSVHRIGWPFFKEDIVSHHFLAITVNKVIYPILAFFKANILHRQNNFNAVWSLMANYSGFAAFFFKLANPKVSMILSLQEGDSEKHLKYRWGGLIALAWKATLWKADFLLAISNYLLDRAKNIGYKGESKLVPNGVDVKKFSQALSNEEREKIRNELGIKAEDVALVTSSRLNIKNGITDVIQAMVTLPKNIKFVVLGTGELERELETQAEKLLVSDRVIFRGHVSHTDLYKYLKACDIFIRPSLSEGMGNSFIEAMIARLPVIATPVGGIVDFVFDSPETAAKNTGYFCQPKNPKSIVDTVKRVVTDPKVGEVIENAYKLASQKYDWEKITKMVSSTVIPKV